MRAAVNIFLLTLSLSLQVQANNICRPFVMEKDSLNQVNPMAIEVNVPEAHTIETELGFVEDGGILFTRQTVVTIFGTVKTANKLQEVKINGKKAQFSPEGDRYNFHRKLHLEDDYNTITVSVMDIKNMVKEIVFTIHRKNN